jgi:dTDP-4-dehydrorhamnose 3,5-epimerase
MDVTPTQLPEVLLIDLVKRSDDRGFFLEHYHEQRFAALGLPIAWRQDNRSRSYANVLRGLHYQLARPQGKLVACLRGEVFDVAVDVRVGSPTFGQWAAVELSEDRPQVLWIPPGYAHGFCALSDVADLLYKCTDVYVGDDERGIIWNDPDLRIDWPVRQPMLSSRDRALPALRDATAQLPRFATAPIAG